MLASYFTVDLADLMVFLPSSLDRGALSFGTLLPRFPRVLGEARSRVLFGLEMQAVACTPTHSSQSRSTSTWEAERRGKLVRSKSV